MRKSTALSLGQYFFGAQKKHVEIPLHARIMAIADVFDAVSAKRCYRDAMPIDKCFKIIEEGAGIDFDPDLVAIFMGARDKVMKYYQEEK